MQGVPLDGLRRLNATTKKTENIILEALADDCFSLLLLFLCCWHTSNLISNSSSRCFAEVLRLFWYIISLGNTEALFQDVPCSTCLNPSVLTKGRKRKTEDTSSISGVLYLTMSPSACTLTPGSAKWAMNVGTCLRADPAKPLRSPYKLKMYEGISSCKPLLQMLDLDTLQKTIGAAGVAPPTQLMVKP